MAVAIVSSLFGAPAARAGSIISVTTTSQEVNGDADCSLQEAIYAANLDDNIAPDPANPSAFFETGCMAGDGDDTIAMLPAGGVFPMTSAIDDADNYVGPTATPMVTSTVLIEALGARIVHAASGANFRAFAVAGTGNLTIREAHIVGFVAKGGDGATGGGGGLGAGGAVYVHRGTLAVDKTTFEQNAAYGGNGSTGSNVVGGGGGGLGGNGGTPFGGPFVGGGGGGGSRGDGGRGDSDNFAGGAGGGGGGTVEPGESGDANPDTGTGELGGGRECGAAGGHTDIGLGSDDGDDAPCPGGGGGGGESYRPQVGLVGNGDGGGGAYGGGGGGGGYSDGSGGDGGFGGGGGGGTTGGSQLSGFGPNGGDAGFGAGGGSGAGGFISGGPGQGGTFGGDGSELAGGGGGGLGGAIFGHEASITIENSTFTGNVAQRGRSGGDDARDGRGAGGAIFLVAGSLTVRNSTISGNATGEFTTGIGGLGGGGVVVYKPTTGQATSLTLQNTIIAGNGPHECYVRNGAAMNGIGNLIVDNSPNVRADTPCVGVEVTDDPQLGVLQMHAPGRTPTMAIAPTSPAVDAADTATALGVDQRLVLRPQGAGPDIGAYEVVDQPPVTTIELNPASPDGANGWYRSTVGVSITATDPDGTVSQTRCALDPPTVPASFDDLPDADCALSSVGADGAHVIYAASRDGNGTTEHPPVSATFKVDATPPSLNPTLSSTTVTVGQTGVTASPNATDATSGVADQSCGTIDTSSPGVHSVTCTATDNAGNVGQASLDYVVEYRIVGFFEPVAESKWKAGQTVPVKVALGDLSETRISDADAEALAAACRITFSSTGAQTSGPACMRYDPGADQFIYNWKLQKSGVGPATIAVSITYPGTALTTQRTEEIVIIPR